MKLKDKVIVVTGAGSGIGQQLVLQLLERDARVVATDIRAEGLEATSSLASSTDLVTVVADVSDRSSVEAMADKAIQAFGTVDGYISNAGIIQPFVRLPDLPYESIERVINVNLYGTIHMAKAFLPLLLARPEAHVTNVASMGAFLPVPGQTVYGAAKAGVKLLTEGLYAEMLDTNVGVTLVLPGAVATNITENSGVNAPVDPDSAEASEYRTTSAEDAARMILDAIEKDRFHVYVGRDSKTMNLMNRIAPRRSTHLIYEQMKDLLADPESVSQR